MIEIINPGLLTTVQDTGRTGYQAYGVPVCGAMDWISLARSNILAGNEHGEAALEITGIFGKAERNCLAASWCISCPQR